WENEALRIAISRHPGAARKRSFERGQPRMTPCGTTLSPPRSPPASPPKLHHAAHHLPRLHIRKPLVDIRERNPIRDPVVEVQLALVVELDQAGHVHAEAVG